MRSMDLESTGKAYLQQGASVIFDENTYKPYVEQGKSYLSQNPKGKEAGKKALAKFIEGVQNKCYSGVTEIIQNNAENFFLSRGHSLENPDVKAKINHVVTQFKQDQNLYIRGRIHQPLFEHFLTVNRLNDSDVF